MIEIFAFTILSGLFTMFLFGAFINSLTDKTTVKVKEYIYYSAEHNSVMLRCTKNDPPRSYVSNHDGVDFEYIGEL